MLKRNSREEERVERIIRGLVKLPENKRCINCNSLGPQYVCTTFWTFVCTNCSGVHREFTHRVKSVSMAKFSADEVAALQAGGNEQARKTYLKTWDPRRNSFPDSNNLHKLRDFIRHVYIDHKYSGERNNEKVSLEKTGAKDDYFRKKSPGPSSLVVRENFFERRTSEKTDRAQRDESYDYRHSFENFSLVNRDRNSRSYVEETSSQRYGENVRSANRRRRATANFEVVDDRFREDGVRSGGRLGSNRFSHADLRDRSSSPVTEKRSSTCPPPLKGTLQSKIPPPKLAEPPKPKEMENIDSPTQFQKAAISSSPISTGKKEQDHAVNSLNLIDFDANPEPTATTEVVQSQQIVPYGEGGNVSAPNSTNEMVSNIPKVNSTDFLLFELSSPSGAPPSSSTSERPLEGASPSFINEVSLNTDMTMIPASTTNTSLDPNYVGSQAIVPVSQAQKLPSTYQNLSVPVPPGNGSSTYLQASSSGQPLDKKPFCSELALISGPPTNVSSEKSSQDVSNFSQDRSSGNESVSTSRKELPADIFSASHSSFAPRAPGWQYPQHYGMGYGTMVPVNSVKSRNPFDVGDDGPQFQAATFPSMSSFQEVLPDMSASRGPWPQQLPLPFENTSHGMFYQMIPPGAYMGQQMPNNMISSVPQPANNSDDPFASLNPTRLPNSSNHPASARPPSYPSKRENPFG